MKTYTAKPADIDKKWILIDAEGVVLRVQVSGARISQSDGPLNA